MKFDGSEVSFLIAFVAGFVTFFASCLLPLVPTYLAYLSGITITKESKDKHKNIVKRDIFINGLIFTLGFIFIFVLLGAAVNSLGRTLNMHREIIHRIGGIFFILMGTFMLDLIKPMALLKERKVDIQKHLTKFRKVNSFLVGMTFGFAWTPCIGPVLAVILFWASQTTTVYMGMALLTIYGVGLGLPFLIVALLFEFVSPKINKAQKFGMLLQKVAGLIIIVLGILMIINRTQLLSLQLLEIIKIDKFAL